ncbi:MAG: hypothetical protein HYU86_10745 [Chloroflexi bacterium]|nr:hypothetical protein [Chloroflexota bacterium]
MGLLARQVEEGGIPTVAMTSALDITSLVKPPRSVFLDFPLGRQTGKPFDRELQLSIVKAALRALETIIEPGGILQLPYEWGEPW